MSLLLMVGLALFLCSGDALSWPGVRVRTLARRSSPSRLCAASFGEYKAISSGFFKNSSNADVETICNMAAELMRVTLEAEREAEALAAQAEALAAQAKLKAEAEAVEAKLKAEAEALAAQAKLKAEAELAQAKLKAEAEAAEAKLMYRMRAREALRQQQLSELSQRAVLEAFFRDVARCVQSNGTVLDALSRSVQIPEKTKKRIAKDGVGSSMSSINEALQDPLFRDAVWKALKVSDDTKLPYLTSDLLYGDLSGAIHSPSLTEVYVRSNAKEEYVRFFTVLSERFRPSKTLVHFSEEDAALGRLEF